MSALPGLPGDLLRKAAPGFTRGLGAGFHKYQRRVRRMVGGKLRWVYYYDNEKDRKKWLEHAAKDIGEKKEALKELEEQHRAKSDFAADHPELRAARKALKDLTVEYVTELLAWDDAPRMKLSDEVMAQYHKAIIDLYGEKGESDDPHGKPISVMRTLEMAFERMPPVIKQNFSGAMSELMLAMTKEDDYLKENGGVAGYCEFPKKGIENGSRVVVGLERSQSIGADRGAHMKGGLFPVEVLVHEMAHAVHNQIGAHRGGVREGWKGKTWKDWEAFMSGPGGGEKGVTAYAETNNYERWAESWTAALMYPRQLATTAPLAYGFFREFFGPGAMRPLHTDEAALAALNKERETALAAKDYNLARDLAKQADALVGVLDMPEDDARLHWWKKPETTVQRSLREYWAGKSVSYADIYRLEPADETKTGKQGDGHHDRFYEMNVGGRTLFMRVGPSGPGKPYSGWDPTRKDMRSPDNRPTAGELKEIYDAEGNPLDDVSAWWYLHQDMFGDDHPEVAEFGGLTVDPASPAGTLVKRNKLWERLLQVSMAANNPKGGKLFSHDEAQRVNPQEISHQDFRLRSGSFGYDRWGVAGQRELDEMRTETNSVRRDELLKAFMRKQPGVRRTWGARDPKTGRFLKPEVLLAVGPDGGQPVPQMGSIRYVNDNPDGTRTVIEVEQDESGDFNRSGRFFLTSPVWRQLLTPMGEDVRSGEHLEQLCRQAAQERRRAWVSIRTDARGGDTEHYYHVQLEFDGRGQPRVLGDEWKRRLGKDKPRLDDLLTAGRIVEGVEARPQIQAERIKLEAAPRKPKGAERVPKIGDRVVLKVTGEELGRVEGREIVARLTRIIPGKKAGEAPSPPGWDRMPEAVPDLPRDGKAAETLTTDERRLKAKGLLPEWYVGSEAQRAWKREHYDPAYRDWRARKDELTLQEWPVRFVFVGEVAGGASGRTFTRYSEKDAARTTRRPVAARKPRALQHDLLVYAHQKVDAVTGLVTEQEPRILLPKDGTVTLDVLKGIHGVEIASEDITGETYIRVNMDGFARLREYLGGVSLTADAEQMLRSKADLLREAAERAKRKEHVMEIEDIDAKKLRASGVGVKDTLPDGTAFELAAHQKELLQLALDNGGRALGAHFMGTGKGGRKADKLLTPRGWTTYGEVRVGDAVIGSDGRAHCVTGVFPRGVLDVYRVEFSDGAATYCDDDHIWPVRSARARMRDEPHSPTTTHEIRTAGLKDEYGNSRYFVPLVAPVEFENVDPLPVDPYLLGYLLGNGALSQADVRVSIPDGDDEVVSMLSSALPDGSRLVFKSNVDWCVRGVELRDRLAALGLMGKKSVDKEIPLLYQFASREDRVALLHGLMDSDGYASERDNSVEYSTSSKRLVEHFRALVWSLGGLAPMSVKAEPKYRYRGEMRTGQPHYRVRVSLPDSIPPFALARKASRLTPRERKLCRSIASIEPVGRDEIICISVDALDSLYVTDDYVVTHNTPSAIVLAKTLLAQRDPKDPTRRDPKAPSRVLIVAPLNTVEQWRQASETFDEGCHVIGQGKDEIPASEFVKGVKAGRYANELAVVGPEYFTIHQKELREAGFDGLVMDEAHMGLKNEKAQRNAAVEAWNPHMKMLFLLTGTPMTTSPADFLEYVKLLSNGEQWAGMTRSQFIEEYLEESPVPGELGVKGRKGPKVQIKPEKRAELAAIIAQWTHIAMPKDVRGKTLPAVRIEETQHAHMTGTQAMLYAMRMAALSDKDRERLKDNTGALAEDETAGLDTEAKKQVQAAKATANCLSFKPQSDERFLSTYKDVPDEKGKIKRTKTDWVRFNPDDLMSKTLRKKLAGRWPTIEEIGQHEAALYSLHAQDVIGTDDYAKVAGTRITPEQLAKMRSDDWLANGGKLRNPEAGPTGIRSRGYDTPAPPHPDLEEAIAFQREYGNLIVTGTLDPKSGRMRKLAPEEALYQAMRNRGIADEDTAHEYLGMKPDATEHHKVTSYGGVTVNEGEHWVSDTRGSLHLLYRPEDWDEDTNRPRSAGGFGKVNDGDLVEIKRDAGVKRPKEIAKEDWEPPQFRYDKAQGEKDGRVAVVRQDTGETIWVAKADVSARVRSLMDPGMRAERAKADVAMVVGNAKSEELRAYISRFHADGGQPGPDGARQMVLFANGILDGCRTMEATLRVMGFKDVNEALDGSPHFDKDDAGPAPNGKYFVTYIGSTYTGDRDLNVSIFQKRKDKLGRDSHESLMVHKCNTGQPWSVYPGDDPNPALQVSQWTTEQREQIKKQYKITPPEAYTTAPDGVLRYFYGTRRSEAIRRELALAGDPTKIADSGEAEAVRKQIQTLKGEYESIVTREAVTKPPLTKKQETVFNSTEMIVCSDAAQVGMNLGNAAELVMYDSLGSPMAEWQRLTRSARMLPPAVRAELEGTEAEPGPFRKLREQEAALFKPAKRGLAPGIVTGVRLNLGEREISDLGELTFQQALNAVRSNAQSEASVAKTREVRDEWQAIANKAAVAANLGPSQAVAFFEELRETKTPGATTNLMSYGAARYEEPTAGTYDELQIDEPVAAVQRAISGLSESERAAIARAGFVKPGATGEGGGSLDGASVYLAIRAQEILDHIEKRRPEMAATMRSVAAGKVVTDADVTNAVVDELTPEDRAVLKAKKYLVNARRIGISAYVPQMATVTRTEEGPEGEQQVRESVFIGHEKQHPIAPEANTRAVGRARMVSNEALLHDVQNGVVFRTDLDYQTTSASDIADMSRTDIVKAQAIPGLYLFPRVAHA